MKPTLDTIAYDFLTTLKQMHDDSEITLRMVKYWIQSSRAVWVTNELNKYKPISPEFIQDLGVINIEPVVSSQGVMPATLTERLEGYQLLRSTIDLPVFLESGGEPAVTRIGPTIVGTAKYKFIPMERVRYVGYGRFTDTTIYAFIDNHRLYLATRADAFQYVAMRRTNVRGVLADPTDAARFTDASGNACYTDTMEYPITQRLVAYMKEALIQSEGRILLTVVPDKFNNANDDTPQSNSSATSRASNQEQG